VVDRFACKWRSHQGEAERIGLSGTLEATDLDG
jgi:hypothetical protein